MTDWARFEGGEKEWNARLSGLIGANFFQSFAWGEVKRRLEWNVTRLSTKNAAAQVLWRKYSLGTVVAWIPGGPVGEINGWCDSLPLAIRRFSGALSLYVRINALYPEGSDSEGVDSSHQTLSKRGWKIPARRMTSGLSLGYMFGRPEEARVAALTRDWRSNLKRSGKHGLNVFKWNAPEVGLVLSIFRQMENMKGIASQISVDELQAYVDLLADRLIWIRGDDASGRPIAVRVAAVFGDHVWEMLAAATPEARKVSASHAVLWKMLEFCSSIGATTYDLGGIDPVGNKGVFDFKQGVGAQRIEYLGEWEWASNVLIRVAANYAIGRRRGGL